MNAPTALQTSNRHLQGVNTTSRENANFLVVHQDTDIRDSQNGTVTLRDLPQTLPYMKNETTGVPAVLIRFAPAKAP